MTTNDDVDERDADLDRDFDFDFDCDRDLERDLEAAPPGLRLIFFL